VEAYFSLKLLCRVSELVADLFPLLHCVPRVTLEFLTLEGELDRAVVAVEQRRIECGFQLPDVARQGGSADVCTTAGAAKIQGLAQQDEVFKRSDVQGASMHPPCVIRDKTLRIYQFTKHWPHGRIQPNTL
ncbi:MAG: hypothetical protein ACI8XD_000096, partial [Thermoproteota archaeon]